jgi:MFS family permease
VSVATLAFMGVVENFYLVVGLIVVWALLSAAALPIRQTYLNGLIPSTERASILSFDSMMASLGGVGVQPALGRAADVWGYGPSYLIGAAISALAVPFLFLSRKENARADTVEVTDAPIEPQPA